VFYNSGIVKGKERMNLDAEKLACSPCLMPSLETWLRSISKNRLFNGQQEVQMSFIFYSASVNNSAVCKPTLMWFKDLRNKTCGETCGEPWI